MSHTCDAITICCIDFRFQRYIRDWTDKNLPGKTFDLVGFAGSSKDLDTILKQIDISVRLHQIKEVIIIHHEECGAYGVDSTPERHATDLRHARTEILSRYPNLQVYLLYAKLDGKFAPIN